MNTVMKIRDTAKKISCAGAACAVLLAVPYASQAATDSATVTVTATVAANTCTAGWDASGVTVDLGTLNGSALKAKGDLVGKKDFTLQLKDCGDSASAVKVTATGTADGDGFAVDTGTGAATGVNVMVYGKGSDGNEVALKADGTNSVTEAIAKGDATLNFAAAVARTSDTAPVAGTVSSKLTLNIDYQ